MYRFISIALLFVSFNVFAGLGDDFRELKDSGANYEVIGTVCEEVARLRFEEEFPSHQYEVTTGVEYSDGNRTLGELDVVVYERNTQAVVRVAEVKCWKNMRGALTKARSQRQRFITNLQSNKAIYFRSLNSTRQFKKSNFSKVREFLAVAQKGSRTAGFDRELPYQLDELMKLRQMMLECQRKHQCKRPQ